MTSKCQNRLSVSVVIPTYRRLGMLKKCLQGIENLDVEPLEIIIVYRPDEDTLTTDWLRTQVQCHQLWVLVEIYRPGVVAALNKGIRNAKGDLIAIFDDDAVPHSNWLSKIIPHFENNQCVGAAGGRDIVHHNNSPVLYPNIDIAGVRDHWGKHIGNHHLVVGKHRDVDVVKGCNWALRRSALGTLRLDERLLGKGAQYANDLFFCLNLRHYGWSIVLDPAAIVDHYPADKPDHHRNSFSFTKCKEHTANIVYAELFYGGLLARFKYTLFYLLKGERTCPGLYFIVHGLIKRPHKLPSIILGGWVGFIKGLAMVYRYRNDPPGHPSICERLN